MKILSIVDELVVGTRTIALIRDNRNGDEYFFFDGGTVCGPFEPTLDEREKATESLVDTTVRRLQSLGFKK